MQTEVLIVGAGPTGLVLALWLSKLGVPVRIVDRSTSSGAAPRAFLLQARTLEFYQQIGIADDVLRRGKPIQSMAVHFEDGWTQHVPFGDFGRGLSPFPFVLLLLQDRHEKLLIDQLALAGVTVEWDTELVDLEDRADAALAHLKGPRDADEVCAARFVCGCDGQGSTVRDLLKIGFPGGSSEEIFYVADVEASGPTVDGALHYLMTRDHLCSVFPLQGTGRVRLIGLVPAAVRQTQMQIGFDDISREIQLDTDLEVLLVESFAIYRVHQRIADRWRKGHVLLLGDAAHVHSPAGGQGMNAGVGDAVNLAWKLAAVLKDGAPEALLDTYQAERMTAVHQIAKTTGPGFALQAGHGAAMRAFRRALTGLVPSLIQWSAFRRRLFMAISQLAIEYRRAGTCSGKAGRVVGGDRLPWVTFDDQTDNFAPLTGLGWQAQVYGEARDSLRKSCAAWNLPLHVFAWTPSAARAGLARNAVYVVRPDGYVALASVTQAPAAIQRELDRLGIDLRRGSPAASGLSEVKDGRPTRGQVARSGASHETRPDRRPSQ